MKKRGSEARISTQGDEVIVMSSSFLDFWNVLKSRLRCICVAQPGMCRSDCSERGANLLDAEEYFDWGDYTRGRCGARSNSQEMRKDEIQKARSRCAEILRKDDVRDKPFRSYWLGCYVEFGEILIEMDTEDTHISNES